jgi:predicted MFS family arabinose efflux permease
MNNPSPVPDSNLFSIYQKRVLLLLALVQFCIILDFMIIAPIGDILMKAIGINTAQFGIVAS